MRSPPSYIRRAGQRVFFAVARLGREAAVVCARARALRPPDRVSVIIDWTGWALLRPTRDKGWAAASAKA